LFVTHQIFSEGVGKDERRNNHGSAGSERLKSTAVLHDYAFFFVLVKVDQKDYPFSIHIDRHASTIFRETAVVESFF